MDFLVPYSVQRCVRRDKAALTSALWRGGQALTRRRECRHNIIDVDYSNVPGTLRGVAQAVSKFTGKLKVPSARLSDGEEAFHLWKRGC